MEEYVRQLYQDRASEDSTLGIISVKKRHEMDANTDHFDHVLLILADNSQERLWETRHYDYSGISIAVHTASEDQVNDWLLNGTNRRIVDWLLNGQVIFDRNEYVKSFREKLDQFPAEERQLKIGVEFSKLIRRYSDGKSLFEQAHYLDSFNQILHALHHLARFAIIEHGSYPEITVWKQVKKLEPEIYKLYSELTEGDETLGKRLELLMIAIEFEVSRKTRLGAAHLFSLMEQQEEPWSIEDLKQQLSVRDYSLDLGILLEFLIDKGFIDIVLRETKGRKIYHRYYKKTR
ncbi:nucleotidyltransferase-like protein [Salisediminibacterium halotolerans]|uniref:nucleotidyltransferase-like protein n=1 Tax=Salisediminibacterium halotolerans TaxID=517425 RepID=UPI000EAB5161|nr:nucleotidyltransferase-like protein [Salisediminibacterium halotolerans]RLJ79325.1 nucleotidyltransferase-like protein [Actinophytocola xinjiangensis]RPE87047.1 nucleotidyltransferase-like protein [Salisediminibacterium halotolerans]TWG37769.1 nucleotidyltransferase-like protein [Salisediminibacterium halotolerans]GEL09253.1 hypothetical protein SHA02_26690 [Salisediminibacterium halotolerans]